MASSRNGPSVDTSSLLWPTVKGTPVIAEESRKRLWPDEDEPEDEPEHLLKASIARAKASIAEARKAKRELKKN
jgi:hypothetical protein